MYIGKFDAKSTIHDQSPCVHEEQFQECLDELKQAMQRSNVTSKSTEAIETLSNPGLKQQKEVHCDVHVENQVLNSDVVNNSDMDVISKLPESKEKLIEPRNSSRSLPHIFNKTINPSLDDEDGEVWRYVQNMIISI